MRAEQEPRGAQGLIPSWTGKFPLCLSHQIFFLSSLFHLFPHLQGGGPRWEVGRSFADSPHVRVALFDLVRAYLIVKRDLFVFCDRGFVYNVVLERKLI